MFYALGITAGAGVAICIGPSGVHGGGYTDYGGLGGIGCIGQVGLGIGIGSGGVTTNITCHGGVKGGVAAKFTGETGNIEIDNHGDVSGGGGKWGAGYGGLLALYVVKQHMARWF